MIPKQLSDYLTPEEADFLKEKPELLEKLEEKVTSLQKQCDYWRNAYRKMKFVYEANVDPFKKTNIPKP